MTYEELVQSVKDIYANADAGNVKEHVAIQCNIEGEAEGALYIEFSEGNIDVQPYEYYDRDAILTLSAANLLEIAAGKKDLLEAYHANEVSVWGDLDKVVEMKKVILPKKKEEKMWNWRLLWRKQQRRKKLQRRKNRLCHTSNPNASVNINYWNFIFLLLL